MKEQILESIKTLLDNKEKKWLNNYHKIVFKEIAPFLNNDQRSWLEVSCSPIH